MKADSIRTTLNVLYVFAVLVAISLLVLTRYPFTVAIELNKSNIHSLADNAYAVVLKDPELSPIFEYRGDTYTQRRSGLLVLEDGLALSHPHTSQSRVQSLGAGRYLHLRKRELYFSSTDNTDPRTNGRRYELVAPVYPSQILVYAVLGLVLTVVVFCWPFRLVGAGEQLSAAAATFVCVAGLWTWLVVDPSPQILLTGDGGNVAGLVAADSEPERFKADPVFQNTDKYSFYLTLLRPMVQLTASLTGDYGQGYAINTFPILIIQMLGFFLLGRALMGGTFWPTLLAVISVPPVYVFGGELWGNLDTPLSRSLYGAYFPFLLYAALPPTNTGKPYWVMFLCGLGIYIHPVSAPGVALAIWFALLLVPPPRASFVWHAVHMFGAGLLFLAVAIPFAIAFSSGPSSITDPAGASEIAALVEQKIGPQYTAVRVALQMLVSGGVNNSLGDWGLIWVVWLSAAVFLAWQSLGVRRNQRSAFIGLCLVGIFLSSAGIAFLDQTIAAILDRKVLQLDLVRNIRFLVPLLLIGFVWMLMRLSNAADVGSGKARLVGTFGCLFVVGWWCTFDNPIVRSVYGLVVESQPIGISQLSDDGARKAIAFLREQPANSLVLPMPAGGGGGRVELAGLAVRYGGLQPVAFLEKDMNFLLYSGSIGLEHWFELRKSLRMISQQATESTQAGIEFQQLLNAQGVRFIIYYRENERDSLEMMIQSNAKQVFEAGDWSVYEIKPAQP